MIDREEALKILGKRIRQIRLMHKLSQEELGQILGKSASTIYGYENGKIMPPVDVIRDISRLYHISIKDLFGLNESKLYAELMREYYSVLFLDLEAENE